MCWKHTLVFTVLLLVLPTQVAAQIGVLSQFKLDDRDPLEVTMYVVRSLGTALPSTQGSDDSGTVLLISLFEGVEGGTNDLVAFDVPESNLTPSTTKGGRKQVASQDLASGKIFALSHRIVEFGGKLFMSYVHDDRVRVATRAADGSGSWSTRTVASEQVFFGSNIAVTEAGIFVGAFDGFENNIKIFASSDGTNFGLHRTITAPDGGIAGAIRRGKRMALAGSRDMYCVLYGETFTGLTQMRMNCEKNPKIQAQSASVQNTGGTQPQAEADPEEDDWLTGLNEPHDKDLQPETALILGSLLDEAGEEAIRFGLAATFVRGELDSMQPQVWLHGFTGREAVNAVKAVGQRLSRLDTVLRIAVQAQLTTGMVLFHETAGGGGRGVVKPAGS